jgi:all-trans-retinol 13,14-reductase
MKTDFLIVGSGLSALVFGALMANAGKTVRVLEVHEHPGGFGHTFTMANQYTFNAQLHYVWDCGEGDTVNRVLKKLNLDKEVTFERYDPDRFDRMRMPGMPWTCLQTRRNSSDGCPNCSLRMPRTCESSC